VSIKSDVLKDDASSFVPSHTMSHPPSPRDTHPPTSTMSEFDSLSDSEWLDISSSRDSDEESLSDHDSDRDEISSVLRSRRSSISNDDSVTSDVEAWEGFVSDGGEEPETGMYPVAFPSPLGAEPITVGFVSGITKGEGHATAEEEEQRVKQALDQSLIGTLNNSRSSNSGPSSTSVRDLRLSFPDPLNSSKGELNRSYEDVPSPTDTAISASTDLDAHAHAPLVAESPLLEDPDLSKITSVIQNQHHEAQQTELEQKDALTIVLYGSSSEVKWRFLQELIQKAMITSGYVFVSKLRENEQTQSVQLVRSSEKSLPFFSVIHIHDRTARDATIGAIVSIVLYLYFYLLHHFLLLDNLRIHLRRPNILPWPSYTCQLRSFLFFHGIPPTFPLLFPPLQTWTRR
jgi:hypothetical protein